MGWADLMHTGSNKQQAKRGSYGGRARQAWSRHRAGVIQAEVGEARSVTAGAEVSKFGRGRAGVEREREAQGGGGEQEQGGEGEAEEVSR